MSLCYMSLQGHTLKRLQVNIFSVERDNLGQGNKAPNSRLQFQPFNENTSGRGKEGIQYTIEMIVWINWGEGFMYRNLYVELGERGSRSLYASVIFAFQTRVKKTRWLKSSLFKMKIQTYSSKAKQNAPFFL